MAAGELDESDVAACWARFEELGHHEEAGAEGRALGWIKTQKRAGEVAPKKKAKKASTGKKGAKTSKRDDGDNDVPPGMKKIISPTTGEAVYIKAKSALEAPESSEYQQWPTHLPEIGVPDGTWVVRDPRGVFHRWCGRRHANTQPKFSAELGGWAADTMGSHEIWRLDIKAVAS